MLTEKKQLYTDPKPKTSNFVTALFVVVTFGNYIYLYWTISIFTYWTKLFAYVCYIVFPVMILSHLLCEIIKKHHSRIIIRKGLLAAYIGLNVYFAFLTAFCFYTATVSNDVGVSYSIGLGVIAFIALGLTALNTWILRKSN